QEPAGQTDYDMHAMRHLPMPPGRETRETRLADGRRGALAWSAPRLVAADEWLRGECGWSAGRGAGDARRVQRKASGGQRAPADDRRCRRGDGGRRRRDVRADVLTQRAPYLVVQ